MTVRLVLRRIAHHAEHSGYDQLAAYVGAEPYAPGALYRLAARMPGRWTRALHRRLGYREGTEALFREVEIGLQSLVPGRRLWHFTYGEDSLRLAARIRPRWRNRIVATFHQPPALSAAMGLDRRIVRRLDAAIVLCEEQRRFFEQMLAPEQVFLIPHGVDTGFWSPDPAAPPAAEPTFLTVGSWQRDFDLLRAAIESAHARDRRLRFRIAGAEDAAAKLAGLPQTTLLPRLDDGELRREYRRATALLLPLTAVTANNAVLEALGCGTPVLGTRVGGLPDYVDDSGGALVAPGDAAALAERMLQLAGDAALRRRAGAAARARSLRFDWRRIGAELRYVYDRLLGRDCAAHFRQAEAAPRNLCLLTEEYPPETGWGGIATYNRNLARGLAAAGHRVFVIAGCAGQQPSVTVDDGVEVHRVAYTPRRRWARKPWRLLLQPFLHRRWIEFLRRLEFGLAARRRFAWLQARVPIHLIESPEYYGSSWFLRRRFAQYPVVVKLHTPTEVNCHVNDLPVTFDVRLCNWLEKRATRGADLVCAPSRKIVELVERTWLPGLREVRLLEYPIDARKYSPNGTPVATPRAFLFTGRLERRKGVHVLVRAFDRVAAEIPDVELHLAGHDTPTFQAGDRILRFEEYLGTLGLRPQTLARIRFLGRKSLDELVPLYRAAYACVIPSVAFENFPNTCLEAIACGKAVIVTDAGGMVEMAPASVAGLHVRAGDEAALAGAMLALARDPELVARLGAGARRTVLERYDTPIVVAKITAAYEELIRKARYR